MTSSIKGFGKSDTDSQTANVFVFSPSSRANCFTSLYVFSSAVGHLETHKAMDFTFMVVKSMLHGSRKKTFLTERTHHNTHVTISFRIRIQADVMSGTSVKSFCLEREEKGIYVGCPAAQIPLCSRNAFVQSPSRDGNQPVNNARAIVSPTLACRLHANAKLLPTERMIRVIYGHVNLNNKRGYVTYFI